MKKIIILLICTSFFEASAKIKSSKPVETNQTTQSQTDQDRMNKKDCVMMRNGKMLMMKDGKTIDMPAQVVLNDGSIIYANGTIKLRDGSVKVLKNGDSVYMDGRRERIGVNTPTR